MSSVSSHLERVRTETLEIVYEESGPPDGDPVVLVHGFPTTRAPGMRSRRRSWRPDIERSLLAKVLKQWKLGAWERLTGRPPKPDALIVPSAEGQHRRDTVVLRRFSR